MTIVKLQDIKSTHRNPLHSYTLIMRKQKEKLRKQFTFSSSSSSQVGFLVPPVQEAHSCPVARPCLHPLFSGLLPSHPSGLSSNVHSLQSKPPPPLHSLFHFVSFPFMLLCVLSICFLGFCLFPPTQTVSSVRVGNLSLGVTSAQAPSVHSILVEWIMGNPGWTKKANLRFTT